MLLLQIPFPAQLISRFLNILFRFQRPYHQDIFLINDQHTFQPAYQYLFIGWRMDHQRVGIRDFIVLLRPICHYITLSFPPKIVKTPPGTYITPAYICHITYNVSGFLHDRIIKTYRWGRWIPILDKTLFTLFTVSTRSVEYVKYIHRMFLERTE